MAHVQERRYPGTSAAYNTSYGGESPVSDPTQASRAAALDRAISPPRYASYLLAAGGDPERARELYVWDRNVASAVFADLAIVEVALRNAMHEALAQVWGPDWYDSGAVVLDNRSRNQLDTAKSHLPAGLVSAAGPDLPGRVVAQCMFGFWVNLLDSGNYVGHGNQRRRVDYEVLWRQALNHAFPGGRPEARLDPSPGAHFTRGWVHGIAKVVNELRNRVAHHEPLQNGFPLNGQQARMTVREGFDTYLRLTRMIDRDLAAWVESDTRVLNLLTERP